MSEIFAVPNTPPDNSQRFYPTITGSPSFEPGMNSTFGFAHTWPQFTKTYWSDDARNHDKLRHIRVYPLYAGASTTARVQVPNSYVLAMEDWDRQWPFDYNDLMVVVRNVKPASVKLEAQSSAHRRHLAHITMTLAGLEMLQDGLKTCMDIPTPGTGHR